MLPMFEDHREVDFSKAMYVPLGLASPLWLPFAAATGAGLAFWWMTRWTRPANLEALMEPVAPPTTSPVVVEAALQPAEAVAIQTEDVVEATAETMQTAAEETQDAIQAVVETAEAGPAAPKKKPKPLPEAPLH